MKKMIAVFAVLLSFTSVWAVNLQFKLDVNSSGSDLYACNAGLKHASHAARVCFERHNPSVACNPGDCKTGEACNCRCTGGGFETNSSDAGEYRLDFFKAAYSQWDEAVNGLGSIVTKNVEAGTQTFNQLFSTQNLSVKNQLKTLEFNLGSERYGAKYFVDICFRATQIEYPADLGLYWLAKRQVTITDLSSMLAGTDNYTHTGHDPVTYSEQPYQVLAGLDVKSVLQCKTKNGEFLTRSSDWTDFSTAQVVGFDNFGTTKDLKGCIVRYLFRESNRDGLASIRRWKMQKARICTLTSFNEDI